MKCPNCNGQRYKAPDVPCGRCAGKGVVEPLTNEEWLCSLPTEEKATWLSKQSQFIYGCGQKGQVPKALHEEDWEYWLKEKHNE